MIKYYGCYRYLHFYSDVYVLPFVYGRLESAISFDWLGQGQIFKEDVAALKRVSAGSPVHLWSHIICVVPFAAIGEDGIYCQCMYGRLRRAVPECQHFACDGLSIGRYADIKWDCDAFVCQYLWAETRQYSPGH